MQDQKPDPEDGEKSEKTSFWKTMPGILAGVAAIVTALAALLTAVDKTNLFSGGADSASAPPQESKTEGGVTTSGDNSPVVQDTDGNVTITGNQ